MDGIPHPHLHVLDSSISVVVLSILATSPETPEVLLHHPEPGAPKLLAPILSHYQNYLK